MLSLLHGGTACPRIPGLVAAAALATLLVGLCPLSFSQEREGDGGDREPFVTALTGKFPPFSYYDQDGELAGFDVDVSREIARRMGRQSKIVATEWDGILAGLLAGKYDAIIGSMAITEERSRQVLFSTPYYESGAQLFVHRENPNQVYGIEECSGLRIATVLGETYQHYLEENHPEVRVVTFKSSVEYFEMLEQHRISGFVTDRLVGAWQVKQAGRPFVPVGNMLYRERIAIPVRKGEAALLEEINAALRSMREDGTMARVRDRYFGLGGAKSRAVGDISPAVAARKLLRGFGITLGIAAFAIVLGFCLSVPVGLILTSRAYALAPFRIAMRTIVDFLRGTPVLIQLLFAWLGLGLSPIPAAILTLGVNAMAYMSEVIRSGLMSVPPGQSLAAKALGLSPWQRFRHVIWPQAFRIAVPPLMNSVVALVKDTALVAIISIPEVIREAQSIISITFQPSKYYFITAVMFFIVTFPLMKTAGLLEARIKKRGFAND